MKTYKKTFEVRIPNLDGDGVAEVVPVKVDVWKDSETNEEILTPESLDLIEKTRARHMGLMAPEEIKGLRERLGLTQEQMSELLQIGGKSYTRWESGRARPSRSINVLLCALRDGRVDVNYLEALRNPEAGWMVSAMSQWKSRSLRVESLQAAWDFYLASAWSEPSSVEGCLISYMGPQQLRRGGVAIRTRHGVGQSVLIRGIVGPAECITFEEETEEQEGRAA